MGRHLRPSIWITPEAYPEKSEGNPLMYLDRQLPNVFELTFGHLMVWLGIIAFMAVIG